LAMPRKAAKPLEFPEIWWQHDERFMATPSWALGVRFFPFRGVTPRMASDRAVGASATILGNVPLFLQGVPPATQLDQLDDEVQCPRQDLADLGVGDAIPRVEEALDGRDLAVGRAARAGGWFMLGFSVVCSFEHYREGWGWSSECREPERDISGIGPSRHHFSGNSPAKIRPKRFTRRTLYGHGLGH
jgi:hypothetical protein